MAWPEWFCSFCRPESDRREALVQALQSAGVPFDALDLAGSRHLQIRGNKPPLPHDGEIVLIAHYDRVAGSPGANDNGASVFALVNAAIAAQGTGFRIVLTDKEELAAGQGAPDQGSYILAQLWSGIRKLTPIVFDMTGIGDTWVLGRRAQSLVRQIRGPVAPHALDDAAKLQLWAKRWLGNCGSGRTIEAEVPFSDDLGLLAGGLSAVQISLLPFREASAYLKGSGELPPSWSTMHTPDDRLETLWVSSVPVVAQALEALKRFALV